MPEETGPISLYGHRFLKLPRLLLSITRVKEGRQPLKLLFPLPYQGRGIKGEGS